MSERIETLKAMANTVFTRFDNAVKDLNDKEIDWRPVIEANNIRWILTHVSQQWNLNPQRSKRADYSYKPEGWPDDYIGNTSYTLKKIMDDLARGKAGVMGVLAGFQPKDLDVEITTPRGARKRADLFMSLLSEAAHHEGQIAYIRGAIGRIRQKDPKFLT